MARAARKTRNSVAPVAANDGHVGKDSNGEAANPGCRLKIGLIACGDEYQTAAAWAAATYTRFLPNPSAVSIWVPKWERLKPRIQANAKRYGFQIRKFRLKLVSYLKFTSQLKCQGFLAAASELREDELLLLVDADTFCRRALSFSVEVLAVVQGGGIALAPDLIDRHIVNPKDPCYLAPEERVSYVNSGVILAGKKSLSMFRKFRELSERPRFLRGQFNDQKVINYALGKYFKGRLALLGREYNHMRDHAGSGALIGHCTGGAGCLSRQPRETVHRRICRALLSGTASL
jgi:hypothetical protein